VFSRDISQFYLHTHVFIHRWNEPYLPLPSQPKLVRIHSFNFYTHAFLSDNIVSCTVFMSLLKTDSDKVLKLVVMFKTAADDMVDVSFEVYVSSSD